MNTTQLVGRLTKEVELKYSASGTAVGNFTLAVNRSFTNQQGEREADFINCVIWRKGAENLANFTRKGSRIGIEGRIQTRNYDNQQGQKVYVTEVVVNNFHLLDPRNETEQRPTSQNTAQQYQGNGYQNNNYQNNNYQQQQPQQAQQYNYNYGHESALAEGRPVQINEDDLPF